MPVPLGIVAIAAARAIAGAAGKRVVSATVGKSAATKYATAKAASNAKALKAAADRKALKKIAKSKPLAEPKSAVKVVPGSDKIQRTLKNSGSTLKSVKAATGQSAREGASRRNLVNRASAELGNIPKPVKINTDPTKPKGVFGPLKKQLDISSGAARGRSVANAKALKGLKPLKTKKK